MIRTVRADGKRFALFHTVYTNADLFARFDWHARVADALECISGQACYFVHDGNRRIGGFVLRENQLQFYTRSTPACAQCADD